MLRFCPRYLSFAVLWLCVPVSLQSVAQTKRALLIGISHYAPPPGATLPVAAAGHAPDSRFAPGASWNNLSGPPADVASMQVLLTETYGFQDIRALPEQQATRQGILTAIDQLTADTKPGDLVVFYYAGHGSQRLDTLSSKNHLDQTIVPIDAWKGARDIRDKELALLFDKIVFDKHAHLTAIYDSCDSGTMARGITDSIQRYEPYDDRDVAQEKKTDPATVTQLDLKQIPQNGDATIVAAAGPAESAVEKPYADDGQVHGAFTRALVRVLQPNTQALSAEDVVAEVSNMLHADPSTPQQPSVEGRTQESLFGDPVAAHALHVHVARVSGTKLTLDMGSAAGFDAGTQFTEIGPGAGGQKTVLEVQQVYEPLASRADVVEGAAKVKVGQTFELTKMVYPQESRLVIFAPKPEPVWPSAIAEAKRLFPRLTWVDDPAESPIDFLVVDEQTGWVAYDQGGHAVKPGRAAQGTAFLLLGPPPSLKAAIEQSAPFQRNAFSFTPKLTEADYLLAARISPAGTAEYSLLDRVVLTPHKPDAWVRSVEEDPDDTALNGGVKPAVVCRNDVSLPIRTAWLADHSESGGDIVVALNRRIVRLGKLRVWLKSPSLATGIEGWPYHLSVTEVSSEKPVSLPLHPDQTYEVRLVATADQRAATTLIPRYLYLFGFDCAANPFLLYPPRGLNGDAQTPQMGQDGQYPLSVALKEERVGTPLGLDTLFLLVTAEKMTEPQLLLSDGVIDRGTRGSSNRFDQLITDMSNAGVRGPTDVPTNWMVQQFLLPSRP